MTVTNADLQQLLSPVSMPAWSGRWARAGMKAASLGPGSPVVLTETMELGAVIWQAPSGGGRVQLGDIELCGLWITSPTRTGLGRWLRKAQLRALFAPERGFGSAGNHPTGQVWCAFAGAAAGAAAGGYGLGGPLALVWGALVGAVVGVGLCMVAVVVGKRRVHGPVNTDDPDLLDTVLRLLQVRVGALALADFDGGCDTRRAVREMLWHITDPATTDEEYRRLRYQASILADAVEQANRAQIVLDTVTAVDDLAWARAQTRTERVTDTADEAVRRLQAHTTAMTEVADQIRTIRRRA